MNGEPTSATTVTQAGQPSAQQPAAPPPPPVPAQLQTFLVSLLDLQCRLVGAVAGVVYLTASPARRAGLAAQFAGAPGKNGPLLDAVTLRRLERLGAQATQQPVALAAPGEGVAAARGIVEPLTPSDDGGIYRADTTHLAIAAPLIVEGRAEGASIVLVPADRRYNTEDALRRLALTCAHVESYLWRQQCLAEAQQKAKLRETLDLLDASLQGQSAESMGSLLTHELQRRFGCSRASIGLIRAGRLRLSAVSAADEIDRHGAAVEAIEAAMEECADQDIEIVYPPPPEAQRDASQRRVTRAHEALSAKFGPSSILSLPLRVEGDTVGVALLERDPLDPFPPGSVPLLRLVAEFTGPALWTRRLADRGIFAVTRDRTLDLGRAIVGPRHTGAKLVGLIILLAFLLLAFVPIPSRLTATGEVKSSRSRTISPPYSGYIEKVFVKPGDTVAEGAIMAHLDTRELELKLAELEATAASYRAQRDEAQTKGDSPKAKVLDAQIAETQAGIDPITDMIKRADVTAPFSGKVSRGDLEPFEGARVEPTQPLFELVTDAVVVVAQVDERDIGRTAEGQDGWLALKAVPGTKIPLTVTRINPTAQAVRNANVYLVELRVDQPTPGLLPGMTGTVKLRAGWTTGLASILRPIVDEARLRFWW